mmetsp:Transcript_14658/g.48119  ORF Transcript_14658/g.48119 Transcript_14658/m.48119 type:complete len:213 (+) Transcript_14658:2680-3318(+)
MVNSAMRLRNIIAVAARAFFSSFLPFYATPSARAWPRLPEELERSSRDSVFLPRRLRAVAAIWLEVRPARSSWKSGEPCGMYTSGSVSGLTLRLPSRWPLSARYWSTCAAKPPMAFSSTVMRTLWLLASCLMSLVSRGLQKRASATVHSIPKRSLSSAAAARHSFVLAPYPRRAQSFPSRSTTPWPISHGVPLRSAPTPCAARSTPMPFPRG